MPLQKEALYTVDYIGSLPEGKRAELIDGLIYDMTPAPRTQHQRISFSLSRKIADHIDEKGLPCEVIPAPFGVYIDEYNYFEPDISIICDRDKISDRGCEGCPDWIIEIVSPSSQTMDYLRKLNRYQAAGARLYWIVDPDHGTVSVYDFEHDSFSKYRFTDPVPVSICKDFSVRVADGVE